MFHRQTAVIGQRAKKHVANNCTKGSATKRAEFEVYFVPSVPKIIDDYKSFTPVRIFKNMTFLRYSARKCVATEFVDRFGFVIMCQRTHRDIRELAHKLSQLDRQENPQLQ